MAEKRARWHEDLAAEPVSGLVFVDESGASTKMTRWRGRSPAGERLRAKIPHGHYETTTLVAGVRLSGPCAPWLFKGAMDGDLFRAWVVEGLAPTLHQNDLVIMDNLATHKVKGIAEALAAVGARLVYLPPYSPDFNPIENMWSKVKEAIRSRAPRTDAKLTQAAKAAFQAVSAADCQGFFLNAKYAT